VTISVASKFDRDVVMKRVKVITIAFAFMLVLVAASAQPVAAASRSDSLTSYISGRYDVERGAYSPPSDDVVRVDATYGAILAYDQLGSLVSRPPPVNITKVLDALILRQWTSNEEDNDLDEERYGGFSEYLLGPVTMGMTMKGVILLEMLKAQADYPGISGKDIDTEGLLDFINRTQTESGGFSSVPGNDPDIVSTYQALYIIDFLSIYDTNLTAWSILTNESATLDWINDCGIDDVFMLSPESVRGSVTATAAGILALDLLPSISTVPGLQDAVDWVLERQIEDSTNEEYIGGFEEGLETNDPNFKSTYYALKLLEYSGGLVSVNETIVIDFILNCQAGDGSWGYIPGLSTGSLVYAGQACELLNLFGSASSILGSSVDPNSPGGFSLDWRAIVLISVILVVIVVAILMVQRD
jgi:prenyltransferase beta subunit